MHFPPPLPLFLLQSSTFLLTATTVTASSASISNTTTPRPEDTILSRNAAIQARLLSQQTAIRGVKKMTDDEGEKFFLDYWDLDDGSEWITAQNATTAGRQRTPVQSEADPDADSGLQPRVYLPRSPSPINNYNDYKRSEKNVYGRLLGRDFQCPSDTHSCAAINRPNSCCSTGEICQLVQDTGSGDVGCCPQGQDCSDTIGKCRAGYTSCSASLGGGCCIPGYSCVTGGCARVYTVTVTSQSTTIISTVTATTPTSTRISETSSITSTTSRSTADLEPPARPTSLSTATTATGDICPIGFYACSAVYHGGCCRTGRDCDTTSCPTTASTTIVTDGRTIVVPVETAAATTAPAANGNGNGDGEGRCANGWFSCAGTVGGGCCPSGYACGTSCTAVGTGTATGEVAKATGSNRGGRLVCAVERVVGVALAVVSLSIWL